MGALGIASGLMICNGYPGELIVEGDLSVRWFFWAFSLCPFTYVVYELVDLPSCVHLPNDWLLWFPRRCGDPGGLLRLRHHLQVRRWPCYLRSHRCQVQEWQGGCFVAMKVSHCLDCSCFYFSNLS